MLELLPIAVSPSLDLATCCWICKKDIRKKRCNSHGATGLVWGRLAGAYLRGQPQEGQPEGLQQHRHVAVTEEGLHHLGADQGRSWKEKRRAHVETRTERVGCSSWRLKATRGLIGQDS
jgi:hypothetical protein